MTITVTRLIKSKSQDPSTEREYPVIRLPGAMVARLASIADGTKRLQVRVLRWSFLFLSLLECGNCEFSESESFFL